MNKTFKINEMIYSNADRVMIELAYKKGQGYCIVSTPVNIPETISNSFSTVFDGEYFQRYFSLTHCIIPTNRKNAKKEKEAETYFNEHAREEAEFYIKNKNELTGRHMYIVGEE